ncbi:DNA polymerase III subunit gamma and tau, partial [uncultured Corynebacterium sp.]|uniref:DNA polymerase III subunit gamma and tau n=1 Tax=uncultured Corynebacterium sp. TaxID=159447 RepID=UPI0025FEC360
MALYRKYRPATFAEVVGQSHVTDPLSAALESRGADGAPDRINHAYLFSGPRGCGKTSSARILARSLNCVEGPTATPCGKCDSCVALGPGGPGNLDVVELDAASHNSVEDMRDLRDKAIYAPAEARYRIFIIDEAHMVTNQGFNALLKIVEEPPEHLIFIFATTEPEKVIATIRSRTHHYPFRLLPPKLMKGLLERIVGQEDVAVADDVYPLVVGAGGGSPRDSLSVMDQLLAGAGPDGVSYELAAGLLGVTDQTLLDDAMAALAHGDRAAMFGCVDRVVQSGQDPKRFAEDLLGRVRDLMVIASVPDALEEGLVDSPEDRLDALRAQAEAIPAGTLTRYADVLQRGLSDMSGATSPRLLLEVLCARMMLPASEDSLEALIQRIEALERGGVGGGSTSGAGAAPRQSAPAPQNAQPQQAQQTQQPAAQPAQPAGMGDDANLSPLQRARMARQPQQVQPAQPTAPAQPTPPAQPPEQPQQAQPVDQASPAEPSQPAAPEQPSEAAQPSAPTAPTAPTESTAAAGSGQSAESAPAASAPDVPDQDEQARKAREVREISRRMQEQARAQEREERERMALEREAAARAAEGGSAAVTPDPTSADQPAEVSSDVTQDNDIPAANANTDAPNADESNAGESNAEASTPEAPAADVEPTPPPAQQPAADEATTELAEPDQAAPESEVAESSASDSSAPEQAADESPAVESPTAQAPGGEGAGAGEGASSSDVLSQLRESWPRVVEVAGQTSIPVQVLAGPAVPLALDEDVLTIGHDTGALANRLNDPANAVVLGSAINQIHGIDVEVRCVVGTSPRGGGDRSGARPRQHQAASTEAGEDASPTAGNADDRSRSTIGLSNDDAPPVGMAGGHSTPDQENPTTEMSADAADARVEAREQGQAQARDDADGGSGAAPVPAYRRLIEERRRAMEEAKKAAGARSAQSGQAPGQDAAADDPAKPKYVPTPAAGGTVVRRRGGHDEVPLPPEPHDDVPPPPEPYDDVPPPPEPDSYGGPPGGGNV